MALFHSLTRYTLAAGVSTLLCSCNEDKPVTYVEEIEQPKPAKEQVVNTKIETHGVMESDIPSAAAKAEKGPFSWKVPEGWTGEVNSGIIIAKFTIPGLTDYRCYITRLSGNGGGLNPNIQRWLGQIQVPPLSSAEAFNAFMAKQNSFDVAGGKATVVDFSSLVKDDAAPSMIVGIVSYPGQTLYVKLQGSKGAISEHAAALTALTQSITRN